MYIVINSLRKLDLERGPSWSGSVIPLPEFKHHQTNEYLIHVKQSIMDKCHRENLHQVDFLNPAERKMTEGEYQANRWRETSLEKRNRKMRSERLIPRNMEFQAQKDFLLFAIEKAALSTKHLDQFQQGLSGKYQIRMKISRTSLAISTPTLKS